MPKESYNTFEQAVMDAGLPDHRKLLDGAEEVQETHSALPQPTTKTWPATDEAHDAALEALHGMDRDTEDDDAVAAADMSVLIGLGTENDATGTDGPIDGDNLESIDEDIFVRPPAAEVNTAQDFEDMLAANGLSPSDASLYLMVLRQGASLDELKKEFEQEKKAHDITDQDIDTFLSSALYCERATKVFQHTFGDRTLELVFEELTEKEQDRLDTLLKDTLNSWQKDKTIQRTDREFHNIRTRYRLDKILKKVTLIGNDQEEHKDLTGMYRNGVQDGTISKTQYNILVASDVHFEALSYLAGKRMALSDF